MTLAILARDLETGTFGVAVTSSTVASGGLDGTVHVPRFGICLGISVPGRCQKVGGAILQSGLGAEASMAAMIGADTGIAYRQLGAIDSAGLVAGYTGEQCVPYAAHRVGPDYIVMGNWLAGSQVIDGLQRGFVESEGEAFVRRLIASLEGGRDSGGEISDPLASAAVVAYGDREGTHLADYRVDLADDPVADLLKIHERAAPVQPLIELGRVEPHTLWGALARP